MGMSKTLSPSLPSGVPATAGLADEQRLPARREPSPPATIRDVLARRKVRVHGWTPVKVAAFIEVLADTGSVRAAADYVRMSTVAAYALRNHPDGAPFAEAWDDAVGARYEMLADIALDRIRTGTERLRWWKGERVGQEQVFSDRLLMFMLDKCDPARRAATTGRGVVRDGVRVGAGSGAGGGAGSGAGGDDASVLDTPEPAPVLLADGTFAPEVDAADELAAALAAEFADEDWLPPEIEAGMEHQAIEIADRLAAGAAEEAVLTARIDAALVAGRAEQNGVRGR
jgi:hypothetical protein